ncbi:MAG: hypothetical protein KF893_20845 [Caldilineaceae bacterium]|nr:hypothetical protein [Caldilineaceae bacterium]
MVNLKRWLLILIGLGCLTIIPMQMLRAQTTPVDSPRVSGTLAVQFDRDYLVLRVRDQRRPLRIVMEYTPQNRWELDDRSNFFVFDPEGLEAYLGGANPGATAIAAGDRLPGQGRRLQAVIHQPSRDLYHVVVFNDSAIPMNYILTTDNGTFGDPIGGQIIDLYNPPPSRGGDVPLIVVPGPTATPLPPPPPPLRTRSLQGVLTRRYASNYYELIVLDTNLPLRIQMTYDPPEQFRQDKGFEFNIFTEHQFRVMTRDFILPWRAEDMAEGHLTVTPDGVYIWEAEIVEPLDRYMVVVSQWRYALLWLSYRLTVENGVFLIPQVPTPTPTPVSPLPQPAAGPYVVVQVQRLPTPTPTFTPFVESPLPTPTFDPFAPTPDPFAPSPTPFGMAPQNGALVDAISTPTPVDAPLAVAPTETPIPDSALAFNFRSAAEPEITPESTYQIFLPMTVR